MSTSNNSSTPGSAFQAADERSTPRGRRSSSEVSNDAEEEEDEDEEDDDEDEDDEDNDQSDKDHGDEPTSRRRRSVGGPKPSSSSSQVTSDSGPTVQRRRRRFKPVSKACLQCKTSHLACDNTRPCQRCVHFGREHLCTDTIQKKRGRPKRFKGVLGETIDLAPQSHLPRHHRNLSLDQSLPPLLPASGHEPQFHHRHLQPQMINVGRPPSPHHGALLYPMATPSTSGSRLDSMGVPTSQSEPSSQPYFHDSVNSWFRPSYSPFPLSAQPLPSSPAPLRPSALSASSGAASPSNLRIGELIYALSTSSSATATSGLLPSSMPSSRSTSSSGQSTALTSPHLSYFQPSPPLQTHQLFGGAYAPTQQATGNSTLGLSMPNNYVPLDTWRPTMAQHQMSPFVSLLSAAATSSSSLSNNTATIASLPAPDPAQLPARSSIHSLLSPAPDPMSSSTASSSSPTTSPPSPMRANKLDANADEVATTPLTET